MQPGAANEPRARSAPATRGAGKRAGESEGRCPSEMTMPWYVFALVDTPPHGRLGRGLRGPLRARPSAGAYAIVERRVDVPPVELGSLRAHQAVVSRLARAVPAILPVRFGTL